MAHEKHVRRGKKSRLGLGFAYKLDLGLAQREDVERRWEREEAAGPGS